MSKIVLTLNAGSSSLKFAAFALANGNEPKQLASGQIEGIGATAQGSVETAAGEKSDLTFDASAGRIDHHAAVRAILGWLGEGRLRFFGRRGRPSRRARRPGPRRPDADRRVRDREAEAAHSARAPARAAQYRRDRSGDEGLPVDSAGRLLRHCLPSQSSVRGRHLRAAALLLRRRRSPLRLPRPFLRVHHAKAAQNGACRSRART